MPVARIGESVSYSDKLRAQADLINKRRQQNLDVEIAQEEKNREFTNQQLQAFYDFDVSGMSPEHIKAIGKLQASMANSLDPNSEDHYQNSEQLIADIAFLNNTYNGASRYRDSRPAGTQQMVDLMTGEAKAGPGQEFVNEGMDGLKNANAIWDQGGFSGEINVGGTAGNRSISGVPLVPNPEGGWMEGEGEVNFFESPLINDPTSIYRPTIIAAPPILSTLAEAALSDEALNGTNTEEVANLRWDTMRGDRKEQIAREEYERLATDETAAFEDMTEEQKIALGIDDESLKNTYRDRLQEGVDARPRAAESDVFDFNRAVARMPKLSEPIKLRSQNEEFAGTIEGAEFQKGLDLDTLQTAPNGAPLIPVEVAYVDSSGNISVKILDPVKNPDDYDAFMEAIGRRGKEQLLEYSGYYVTPEGPQVDVGEDPQASNPRDMGVDETAEVRENLEDIEDFTITGSADGSPGAKLESDREMLLLDIEDAEADLRFQTQIGGNALGKLEAMKRLVELQEQLGPLNDALEELGIDRIESDGVDVSAAEASARAELGSEAGSVAAAAQAAAAQADAESRPPQTESTEVQAPQNPAAQPIQTEAPEAAAAIENSNVEATNPNTGDPVTVDASAPEKQQAALVAFGGIIPLETQEAEIQDSIQELFANVAPSDSTWVWDKHQEGFESGKKSDPVPPWCAAWVADMILRANPDFDFSAVESPSYGQTKKQAGEINRVRAEHYQKIGEAVSKTGDRYDAQVGDVVIKKRGKQWHVGFFAGYDEEGNVLILGGNQSDSLNVTAYPADQIVSVRRVEVAAISKEDVEKISAQMNSSGKVT